MLLTQSDELDLALAIKHDAEGQVDRLLDDAPFIAHLGKERIEVNNRVVVLPQFPGHRVKLRRPWQRRL